MTTRIVVIGAGVSGLTAALLLSRDSSNAVTIVAKHMPGDYDIDYASPWAGANILPMVHSEYERRTWQELKRLTLEVPEAGTRFNKVHVIGRDKDIESNPFLKSGDKLFSKDPWYKEIFDDFRTLSPEELPAGFDYGSEFTGVCINVQLYLPWLAGQCLKNGAKIRRATLSHIRDAVSLSHTGQPADILINATGLGARTLGGVMDQDMVPSRGQTVLVRNEAANSPMIAASGTDDTATEVSYLMQRAAGGGTILGGTYDKGNWNGMPDPNIANRIMKRAIALCPGLTNGGGIEALDVVRHGVGLRPHRTSGLRVERELMDLGSDGAKVQVVHSYGHDGYGYQTSYGCAQDVVGLVDEIKKGSA